MIKKILIIDDEADVVKMISFRLKIKGYEVFEAYTGHDGLKMYARNNPDLVLLDYRLPDMPAERIAATIMDTGKSPIILITASAEKIEDKAKDCLAVDYIAKPVSPEELYKKIEKIKVR